MRDVGHFAKSHKLDGHILVLFRHAAANSWVWSWDNANPEANAGPREANATSRAPNIRRRGSKNARLSVTIIICMGGSQGTGVCEGVLSWRDKRDGRPMVLNAASRRDRWVGRGCRHLRRSEQWKFLCMNALDNESGNWIVMHQLTELSNLARLRRPPSTMFSTLISVFPRCSLVFPEVALGALSPLL
jgi:hypothetical protein